jgi:hypothetical protein
MLEASKDIFLDSDWAMVSDLPDWAQAYAEKWPVPTCQAAMYWKEPPAGKFVPESIEVYVNGAADPALAIFRGAVTFGHFDELAKDHDAIAIEFDNIVRYVEIEGNDLLYTVGAMILPDCLISPAAQAQMLLKLAI